jgi:glucose/arabinose dehydrogenase
LTLLVGLFAALYAGPAQALPPGFSETKVTDVPLPTALDFTPDGRMLVTSKSGQVYAYEAGQRRRILDLGPATCDNSERGLLGVAVDPRFGAADRDFVYLYYTKKTNDECSTEPGPPANPVNRVSRFEMRDDGTIARGTEDVLLNNIMSTRGNHNGGTCTSAGTGTST